MARGGDLIKQGQAIERALSDVCGSWTVSAFGSPDCAPAILARPIQGETPISGADQCQCQTVWLISAYAELCEADDGGPYEQIYQVMSGCEPCSIPRLIIAAQSTEFKGVARISVRPPGGFSFTSYNSEENNVYSATVEVVFQYCCCEDNVRALQ